jgi:acyl-CoA reductase-like NAD-dependent aldehyde dehydrogenase
MFWVLNTTNAYFSYIKAGKEAGAVAEIGGNRKGDKGYFIEPTIFSNVTEDMKIVQEEIFGPVCSISKFKTQEEVIKLGNATTYGLAAAVHTKNLNRAIEVSNALRAGTVWVNTYNTRKLSTSLFVMIYANAAISSPPPTAFCMLWTFVAVEEIC